MSKKKNGEVTVADTATPVVDPTTADTAPVVNEGKVDCNLVGSSVTATEEELALMTSPSVYDSAGYNSFTRGKQYRSKFFTRIKWKLKNAWRDFKNKLPVIMFRGDEVDVMITFTGEKLGQTTPFPYYVEVQPQFPPDQIGEATVLLSSAGIQFDTGFGPEGRQWFFDCSLSGPVRVKFVGKTKLANRIKRKE